MSQVASNRDVLKDLENRLNLLNAKLNSLISGELTVSLDRVNAQLQTPRDWTLEFQKAAVPIIFNVDMPLANTEYNQALGSYTRKFTMATKDRSAFRISFIAGQVAVPTTPWFDVKAGEVYWEDDILGTRTLYFASSFTNRIIEIIRWT